MTTDNRTNEPTEAMILAGLNRVDWDAIRAGEADPREAAAHAIWHALQAAAQEAAPQAENADCDRDSMGICKSCGMGLDARKVLDGDFACPVLPSSTAPRTESDERIQAWGRLIQHPVWRSCFEEERPLIDSMMERIDNLAELEMTVNELAPAPVPSSGVDEDALAEVERAAAEKAWDEGYWQGINGYTGPGNPYRAEAYRQERENNE